MSGHAHVCVSECMRVYLYVCLSVCVSLSGCVCVCVFVSFAVRQTRVQLTATKKTGSLGWNLTSWMSLFFFLKGYCQNVDAKSKCQQLVRTKAHTTHTTHTTHTHTHTHSHAIPPCLWRTCVACLPMLWMATASCSPSGMTEAR